MTASPLTTDPSTDPSTVARHVLDLLENAWNAADGFAFGALYAADASFVTVRGDHIVGREAIGGGHHGIFHSVYAGSVNRMDLQRVQDLGADHLLVVSLNTLDCPTGPLAGRHQAMSTSVVVRSLDGAGGDWLVASTHNTLVQGEAHANPTSAATGAREAHRGH